MKCKLLVSLSRVKRCSMCLCVSSLFENSSAYIIKLNYTSKSTSTTDFNRPRLDTGHSLELGFWFTIIRLPDGLVQVCLKLPSLCVALHSILPYSAVRLLRRPRMDRASDIPFFKSVIKSTRYVFIQCYTQSPTPPEFYRKMLKRKSTI